MIPSTRLQNYIPLIEQIEPYKDFVLVFEPPFEDKGKVCLTEQRIQCGELGKDLTGLGIWAEVLKIGRDCKTNLKAGDLVCYTRVGTGSPRKRLGNTRRIAPSLQRKANWQEEDVEAVQACLLLVKEADLVMRAFS